MPLMLRLSPNRLTNAKIRAFQLTMSADIALAIYFIPVMAK